jgi:hypothetical protein
MHWEQAFPGQRVYLSSLQLLYRLAFGKEKVVHILQTMCSVQISKEHLAPSE